MINSNKARGLSMINSNKAHGYCWSAPLKPGGFRKIQTDAEEPYLSGKGLLLLRLTIVPDPQYTDTAFLPICLCFEYITLSAGKLPGIIIICPALSAFLSRKMITVKSVHHRHLRAAVGNNYKAGNLLPCFSAFPVFSSFSTFPGFPALSGFSTFPGFR